MDPRYEYIARPAGAFQENVTGPTAVRLCHRAFGSDTVVDAVTELPWGTYNNAYRVDLRGRPPVVLRVAPAPHRQFAVEKAMLRNEYAAAPYLAPVGALLPRTLFADFTHQLIGRDYVIQSVLPGVPAPEGMGRYSRPEWSGLFRQIGAVARALHEVRGPGFGPVAGPRFESWSEAIRRYFLTAASDVERSGNDSDDVRALAARADRFSAVLDEIAEPRLLHGDGWTANFLVDPRTPELMLTGVCDWDRAEWGDPFADWAIQRALLRPGTERDAFWVGYESSREAVSGIRQQFYRARHVLGFRLDRIRSGEDLTDTYEEIAAILRQLDRAP
ncbi:MAG TPA: aminoglycoside phosphotransferase family protein [Mycobacteriales bacterium]|nr:aminoglycoside phosphotransferase family protein [Mycobacteriales bacterium]